MFLLSTYEYHGGILGVLLGQVAHPCLQLCLIMVERVDEIEESVVASGHVLFEMYGEGESQQQQPAQEG